MNGWQRIALVIFVAWTIFVCLYSWNTVTDSAQSSSESYFDICEMENESAKNSLPQGYVIDKNSIKDCEEVREIAYDNSIKDQLKEWYVIPIGIFAPPLFVLIIWAFSYGILSIVYWIAAGFKEIKKPNKRKQSYLLAAATILLLTILMAIAVIKTNHKEKAFETAKAKCKLDIIASQINKTEESEYLQSCLESKGFKKRLESYCFSEFSSGYFHCYE